MKSAGYLGESARPAASGIDWRLPERKGGLAVDDLRAERICMREDLLAGRTPKRVPLVVKFQLEAACDFAGVDLRRALYDPALVEKACTAVCAHFPSDTFPVVNLRFPWSFQMLGSKNWVVSSTGAIQRPEVESMPAEWYDALIEDPVGTILEKVLPRSCRALDAPPTQRSIRLAKAYATHRQEADITRGIARSLSGQYGYMVPLADGPKTYIPFDMLADHFRGFRGVVMDLRRAPDKVERAVRALLPVCRFQASADGDAAGRVSFIPLHMPPFISTEAFERFYWPTFEEMIRYQVERGVYCNIFAEGDWSRYYDHLDRLPRERVGFQFEEGDACYIKGKLGQKRFFGGFFDPTITLARSREACVDEAKRLIETCAPGGGFYFCFNRNLMDIKSVDVKKLQAVLEWVATQARY